MGINILHVSDAHIQQKDRCQIQEVAEKLIEDVLRVQEEQKIKIELVCFTGDMIQRGDMMMTGEKQWELANEILIKPLLNKLQLTKEQFIFTIGNHEIDRGKILLPVEKGLQVHSKVEIDDIFNGFDKIYNAREEDFIEIVREWYSDVKFGTLGYSFVRDIDGNSVGIVCLDSAWRSTGCGIEERGKLYVSECQVNELYRYIKDTDIKICLMHHPLDWLEECEMTDIEKALTKFDIVLCGHVHEEDDKQVVRQDLKTIYSTAGKLYPLDHSEGRRVDGYNGYTVISVDPLRNLCTMHLRTYFGKRRNEFAAAENICAKGMKVYEINPKNVDVLKEFNIIKGIGAFFNTMSEKYALLRKADEDSPNDIKQVLVAPVLAEQSEYKKEEDGSSNVMLSDIIDTSDNIALIGKKESGKTTIFQQIGLAYIDNYESKKKVPVYIDMNRLPKGKSRMEAASIRFVLENLVDEASVSKSEIKQNILEGKCLFLIDNINTANVDHTVWIREFVTGAGNNRFILALREDFFQSLAVKQLPDYGTRLRGVYVQNMGKAQIREMVTKWSKGKIKGGNINEIVNRIDTYCNQVNFAKTPFNISVFMVLWDSNNNYIPINEGIIMQNYLQVVLEKMSPKESLRTNYSFVIKQDFLSFLAYQMYMKKEYFFTYNEFIGNVNLYHERKGYNLFESKFDKIFFAKNILSYSDDIVSFSHNSILEYCLAVYAASDSNFLREITTKGNRIQFRNEICFYAGLNQNCTGLLDELSNTILGTIVDYLDLIEELNEVEIVTEFRIEKDIFIEEMKKSRPTQNEIDDLSDRVNAYNSRINGIKKYESVEADAEDFFSLLLMYGNVIKNAELMDNKYKIQHLENYMYGMNMLYGFMVKMLEHIQQEEAYSEVESTDPQDDSGNEIKEEDILEATKLLFPIAIQNLVLENIGTPKLTAAIDQLMKAKASKSFEKFMLIFLKCDLNVVNLKKELMPYIKHEKSAAVLKIVLLKLMFYYQSRFFGSDLQMDQDLVDLIMEIQMKLNPMKHQNIIKSSLAKQLKFELDNKGRK